MPHKTDRVYRELADEKDDRWRHKGHRFPLKRVDPKVCPNCLGEGIVKHWDCPVCLGTGEKI